MNITLQHRWQRSDLAATSNICGFHDRETTQLCMGLPLEITDEVQARRWAVRLERTAVWTHGPEAVQARETYAVMAAALRAARFGDEQQAMAPGGVA